MVNTQIVLYLSLSLVSSVGGGNIQGKALNGTLTLAYTLSWNQEWLVGQSIGSAIIIGIEEVYRRQILPGYDIDWVWRDSYCQPRQGMKMAVEMWNAVDDLDAIIGDGCSVVCQPVALLAAAWRIPVVSWGCTSLSLSDKVAYPTFTRVHESWLNLGPVFYHMSESFGWNKVAIVTTPQDIWKLTAEAIRTEMVKNGKIVLFQVFESTVKGNEVDMENLRVLRETVAALKQQVRIFFVMTYPSDIRNFLLTAMENDMLNGEYAFVTIETLIAIEAEPSYRPDIGSELYHGLLGVAVSNPSGPEYDQFRQKVIDAFQHPIFANETGLPPDADIDQVHAYAGRY